VFEPFFSTKPGGSGLGLAMVHRIVHEHGGDVEVRSAAGLGTTFTLTLPVHAAIAEPTRA
jgi:signal transduction histidine kinase